VAELADAQDLGFRVSRVSNLLTDTQQSTAFIRDGICLARILALLCSFFLIVGLQISESTVHAQERSALPDTPKPKVNQRVFVAGVSLLAAGKSADVWSTKNLLDRGGWENNPSVGRHPSSGRLAGHAAATFLGQSTAFYFTERSRHAWLRWTGRVYLGLAIEEHSRLAACN
jgi:hypothetical protein